MTTFAYFSPEIFEIFWDLKVYENSNFKVLMRSFSAITVSTDNNLEWVKLVSSTYNKFWVCLVIFFPAILIWLIKYFYDLLIFDIWILIIAINTFLNK